jgi:hypothetical protein
LIHVLILADFAIEVLRAKNTVEITVGHRSGIQPENGGAKRSRSSASWLVILLAIAFGSPAASQERAEQLNQLCEKLDSQDPNVRIATFEAAVGGND